ncbi:MAG: ribosome-associated translation inhibitor RaiA [Parvibaculum sp.]
MSLRVSGKHMEIGDAFRTRIEDRIDEAVDKYFGGRASGHVTVEKSKSRFTTDCMLHLDSGAMLQATGEAQDPQASFDAAAERIEKRLRRYKRKLKNHNNNNKPPLPAESFPSFVIEAGDEHEEIPEDAQPVIIAEGTTSVPILSVGDAVMRMDLSDAPVVVFRTGGGGGLNLVYRREDGNIGWIDTGRDVVRDDRKA